MQKIILRRAGMEDQDILLAWRNDPLTRSQSRNTGKIPQEEHKKWLKKTLQNPNRQLFIAETAGIPVGTVRADYSENSCELSWTVSPSARGKGVGKRMVALVAQSIKTLITARIKVGNTASERIAAHIGMKLKYEKDAMLYFERPQLKTAP